MLMLHNRRKCEIEALCIGSTRSYDETQDSVNVSHANDHYDSAQDSNQLLSYLAEKIKTAIFKRREEAV